MKDIKVLVLVLVANFVLVASLPTAQSGAEVDLTEGTTTEEEKGEPEKTTERVVTTTTSTTTRRTTPKKKRRPQVTTEKQRETDKIAAQRFKETFSFLKNTTDATKKFRVHFVKFPDGNYTGELNAKGLRHGWGEIFWKTGILYGPGNIFIYSPGDRYVGQWKNHMQNGKNKFQCRKIRSHFIAMKMLKMGKSYGKPVTNFQTI